MLSVESSQVSRVLAMADLITLQEGLLRGSVLQAAMHSGAQIRRASSHEALRVHEEGEGGANFG